MERLMILGAGRTGRGFAGRLAAEGGLPILFVDKDPGLVEELCRAKERGGFEVRFYGDGRKPVRVTDYEACGTADRPDLTGISLVMVSVGGSHLEEAGLWLRENLPEDREVFVITCENAVGPADTLRNAIGLPNVKVSEAAVFCTTNADGIDILSEDYPVLPFDAERLPGFVPPAAVFRGEKNFGNLLLRKIYTYNAASGIIAYMGWLRGYQDYAQAANDPEILELLDRNYAATNRAVCREFGYDPADQEEFALLSRKKFTNPAIRDSIARNAREPQRKLGRTERILGPAELLVRNGEDPSVLYRTAAAALLYRDDADPVWTEIRRTCTPEEILERYGGVKDPGVLDHILRYYKALAVETGENA